MKLTGTIEVKATKSEETILKHLLNGCNYFKKYYLRLCLHYDGINIHRYQMLTEFVFEASQKLSNTDCSYDMRLWFVILKDLRLMQNEYTLCVGLETSLYMEFLTMHIAKISVLLESIFEEIYQEETGFHIGLSRASRTQIL